jgi:hypothetical protein
MPTKTKRKNPAAVMLGRRGGKKTSEAKTAAARANIAKRWLREGEQSGAFPTYFRAAIYEATAGGKNGYQNAGYRLACDARGLIEGDVSDAVIAEHDAIVNSATGFRHEEAAKKLVDWMARTLPRCMALVPPKRMKSFTKGVAIALEQEEIQW